MVDPEIRKEVPDEQIGPAEVLPEEEEDSPRNSQTEIAQQDQVLVLPLVQRARGHEMVHTTANTILLAFTLSFTLPLVVVVSSDVCDQIGWPATNLLVDKMEEGVKWSLFGQFAELVDCLPDSGCILFASLGDEDHVTLDVASGFVMLAVGDLPREVGYEQRRVADPADGIIKRLRRRERLVSTFVCQHPQAGSEQALDYSVCRPQTSSTGRVLNRLGRDEVVKDVEGGRQTGHLSGAVAEATKPRPLEAMFRNGIADVLDRIVWNVELVAVRVEENTTLVLQVIDRPKRR